MPNKTFLETYPLYRPFSAEIPPYPSQVQKPAINFDCPVCASNQTYQIQYNRYIGLQHGDRASSDTTLHAVYFCIACGVDRREFFLYILPDLQSVVKVGQYPARTIKANKDVEQLLGEHKEYLRRGQICEGQGYGIGAFAYYRRIVEEVIDGLLERISELISPEEAVRYQEALNRTKTTRVAAEKIDLVKDLLPPILRPDGINPLRALHEALSEGLHSRSDEDCLELSEVIRDALVFLATQINISTAATRSFTEGMRKILEKRASRGGSA